MLNVVVVCESEILVTDRNEVESTRTLGIGLEL